MFIRVSWQISLSFLYDANRNASHPSIEEHRHKNCSNFTSLNHTFSQILKEIWNTRTFKKNSVCGPICLTAFWHFFTLRFEFDDIFYIHNKILETPFRYRCLIKGTKNLRAKQKRKFIDVAEKNDQIWNIMGLALDQSFFLHENNLCQTRVTKGHL